jgi:hypothetical protein
VKAVNDITQFFLRGLKKMCAEQRAQGKSTPVDEINECRKKAGDSLADEEVQDAMKAALGVSTTLLVTMTIHSVQQALNSAGRVLVRIGDPENVAPESRIAPEELPKKAMDAAHKLAEVMSVLNALSACALEHTDIEHIVETLHAEHLPRLLAEEAGTTQPPQAKPISGTATPLSPRWNPSAN